MYLNKGLIYLSIFSLFIFSNCSKNDVTTGLPSIDAANNKNVGASANDLLTSSKYASIVIEVQYMPGYQPDGASLSNLTAFLNNLVNKPSGIQIIQKQIAASGKSSLSLNDIATIEKNNRTAYTNGSQEAIYILLADAAYSDPNVFGVAYRNTSVSLFGKTIFDNSGNIGQVNRTKLETTVLNHEFGHLLGLVDIGSPMQTNHKDAAHGNHCSNTNCLMYYASETTDLLGFLITGSIPSLDANCHADLHANGGK
ncbi:MAG: hypothetical protein H0W12_01470 [Chitinophagaceae bacterium]|nr:hypothetical protein [Chitinophagaceae bacterium]